MYNQILNITNVIKPSVLIIVCYTNNVQIFEMIQNMLSQHLKFLCNDYVIVY